MQWTDETSYAQGERRAGAEPRVWSVTVAGVRISIILGHIYHRDSWVLTAQPWFSEKVIGSAEDDVDALKRKAMRLVGDRISTLHRDWQKALWETQEERSP